MRDSILCVVGCMITLFGLVLVIWVALLLRAPVEPYCEDIDQKKHCYLPQGYGLEVRQEGDVAYRMFRYSVLHLSIQTKGSESFPSNIVLRKSYIDNPIVFGKLSYYWKYDSFDNRRLMIIVPAGMVVDFFELE